MNLFWQLFTISRGLIQMYERGKSDKTLECKITPPLRIILCGPIRIEVYERILDYILPYVECLLSVYPSEYLHAGEYMRTR